LAKIMGAEKASILLLIDETPLMVAHNVLGEEDVYIIKLGCKFHQHEDATTYLHTTY
jgi:hypothetical protein